MHSQNKQETYQTFEDPIPAHDKSGVTLHQKMEI